jgi:hypothetical protein
MGFFIGPVPGRKKVELAMHSQEGDVLATTEQGVTYELHFGKIFNPLESDIEAGFIKPKEDEKAAEETEDKPGAKRVKSRYLFAEVRFDKEALGPRPEPPTKPEQPADTPAQTDGDAPASAQTAENDPNKPDPKKEYESALSRYDSDVKKYEADLKTYQDKVKTGEKLVKDLNRRFSEWYYVISGDSFESLRQGRKTLVKPKSSADKANTTLPELN